MIVDTYFDVNHQFSIPAPAGTGLIQLHVAGSKAYGTSTPDSDTDYRGVCICPLDYYLGLRRFEQFVSVKSVDITVYDIKKFVGLAAKANPNILETLWAEPFFTTPAWDILSEHRDLFLTQRVEHTFSGYAHSQLLRIKSHRSWLLNPPKAPPTRSQYGLKETSEISKDDLNSMWPVVESFMKSGYNNESEAVVHALAQLNLSPSIHSIVMAERRYSAASKNWAQYQN
jgi:hypothetical protein